MEYNGPLFDEEHLKQKVEEFISRGKISIVVISAAVEETFVKMFSSARAKEVKIICPKSENFPNAEKFPNVSCIIVDGRRVMIVAGPLEKHGWFRWIDEMRDIERVLQLFSELEKTFSIKL